MKNLQAIVGLAGGLLVGCQHKSPTASQPATPPKPQAPLISAPSAPVTSTTLLPVPVPPLLVTQTVPVKGLMPTHLPAPIVTARRDLSSPVLVLINARQAALAKSRTAAAAKRSRSPQVAARPAPVKPPRQQATAQMPPISQARSIAALDRAVAARLAPVALAPILPVNLPNLSAPAPASSSLAEAIAITGIMQTTGKLVAIVKLPNESGRYAQAGDYLAGGQVWLKQIVIGKSGKPPVILQQNGVEVIKSVGASMIAHSF